MPASICDLATMLPLLIGRLLDREAKLKRGRFREETMTDVLTAALAAFAGPNLVIEYPVEVNTGGDLDLRFWHVASASDLHVRIQAKRLNAAMDGMRAVKIAHRSYDELIHKSPTAKDYQFRILRDAPAPWISLYMFYNHHTVTLDPHFTGPQPTVSGVNLAFAGDVAAELEEKLFSAASNPKKIKHHKRLSHLRKHFFGLEAILCPAGDWNGETVPPPHLVSTSLRERYLARGDGTARTKDMDIILHRLSEPARFAIDRGAERDLRSGPSIRFNETLKRPAVTFISGRTDDARTPTITEDYEPSRH
jgi:hypothetical protein